MKNNANMGNQRGCEELPKKSIKIKIFWFWKLLRLALPLSTESEIISLWNYLFWEYENPYVFFVYHSMIYFIFSQN